MCVVSFHFADLVAGLGFTRKRQVELNLMDCIGVVNAPYSCQFRYQI